jgi:cytochrome c oxidase subunit I
MATASVATDFSEGENHEAHHETFITKYIFSTDHKMIAKQFLISGLIWAFIGGLASMFIRMQLGFPKQSLELLRPILGKWITESGTLDPEMYLGMVTMHGTIMMFFVLTAGLSGTFSNLLIPLQIGARDMASGFMNMLSYWFFFVASLIMFASFFVESGPAMGGWTAYPPLSAIKDAVSGSGTGMTLYILGFLFFIVSTTLGSINYIATIVNLRTKGMTFNRMPLSVWSFGITAAIGVLSFPVLFSALLLLFFDRSFGTSFFLSELYVNGKALANQGGAPILYQHLFWFLGHPEVYIIFLPALGITSEVISTNSRKPIFGYQAMIMSMLGIFVLSFVVWAHHMFVTGMNPFLGSVFMLLTLIIAIPSAIKGFNYLTTLWQGNIIFRPAMLFSIGLVSFLFSGGMTGIILGNAVLDIQLHDTYFVVAHFHLVMGSAAFFGMMAGVYHWFPKMYGRMMNDTLGKIHFWMSFAGTYLVFFPMHYLGIAGFPRRYYSFTGFDFTSSFVNLNSFISVAAFITFSAQLIFVANFVYSIFRGKKAPLNPWKSNTLEWTTPEAAPGHGNWDGPLPMVYRWPYDYSKPGAEDDFIPQNVPFSETESSNLENETDELTNPWKEFERLQKLHD